MGLRLRRTIRGMAFAVIGTLFIGMASACSDDNNSAATPECFQVSSATDATQVNAYMAANQTVVNQAVAQNPTVCVIDANGGMRYYDQTDHFADYAMYAMLAGNVHPLIGAGVLTGQIDPFTALILNDMLVSPNSGGYLYHPYMRNASGVYAPNTTVIHNSVHVTNVYYGNNPKAVSYSSTTKSGYKTPKGYSSTGYKIGDSTAQMSGGKISTVKGVTSKSVLQNNGKIPTVTGKTGSGVNSGSGSKFGSGSNKSGSSGSNTNKSSGSKFGSGSSRTSKH